MKTARQDRPASSNIDDATADPASGTTYGHGSKGTLDARANADVYVDVDVSGQARVRFTTTEADLPELLSALAAMGLTPVTTEPTEPTEQPMTPVLEIDVARQLRPNPKHTNQIRNDILVEPSTLWLLDRSGHAVAGLPFADWDNEIKAIATPQRLNWLLRLLLPVVLPSQGLLTGHGAAYLTIGGRGVVMCGLPNSGKTGATLAAVAVGAKFLADDLVIIDPTQRQVAATTLPVSVAYTYLQAYPQFTRHVSKKTLAKLRNKARALRVASALMPPTLAGKLLPARLAKRWLNLLNTRLVLELPVATLFETEQLATSAHVDHVVLLAAAEASRDTSRVTNRGTSEGTSEAISAAAATRRWLLTAKKDTSELRDLYDLHQYAYPDTKCNTLENHNTTVANLLWQLFTDANIQNCSTHSLAVNWQQPNAELIRAGLEELSHGD